MYKYYNKMNTQYKKKLKGGKRIGKGGYGCVVMPALSCNDIDKVKTKKRSTNTITTATKNSKRHFTINNNTTNKTISKIVLNDKKGSIDDEIIINNKLHKLDPLMNYFITILDHCRIKKIPSDRNNIVNVKYKVPDYTSKLFSQLFASSQQSDPSNSLSYHDRYDKTKYDIMHTGKISSKYCPVDIATDPINIIMPYGGNNLEDIMSSIRLETSHKHTLKRTHITKSQININNAHILYKNFKIYIKNLLNGMYVMQNNHIVHKDIKPGNIIIDVNTNNKTNKLNVRYIDFGFTAQLPRKTNTINIMHQSVQGTYEYISIEILIIFYIIDNYHNIKYNDKDYASNNELIFNNMFKFEIIAPHKLLLKELHIDVHNYKATLTDIYNYYIKSIYDSSDSHNELINKYYGMTDKFNGYMQKSDIYGLGLTLYEFIICYNKYFKTKPNIQLFDLLNKMIEIDTNKRYNILECLQHPYIKNH